MDLVVVESPAKARTINRYLGSGYRVLATYGHVRDLPPNDGSVLPDEDFRMKWEVGSKAAKNLKAIADAARGASRVYLATDPDREGEAISWHVREILNQRKALGGVDVKRVVFHEVTAKAVRAAVDNPRELNEALVEAYLARRALDYLVGFKLSPVLWRRLPGSRSAGRVQSVALRIVCERESEIERFVPREYWTVEADFRTAGDGFAVARLTHLDGRKLGRYDLADEAAARAARERIEAGAFRVGDIERKTVQQRPQPPFTTSTMQQEASRKLGFGASRTMRAAQKLYEGANLGGETVGLISYMRTDSVTLSEEALVSARAAIGRECGHAYIPPEPNRYRSKARNAQEAHEAIRPTDCGRRPSDVAVHLPDDERRLYELIWKRTVASQMKNAVLERTAVDIVSADGAATLRANGMVVKFDGFMKLYRETREERESGDGDDRKERLLPAMEKGEEVTCGEIRPEQHFTKPPPRYSEASLVGKLEELGIGRPSTYAPILQVLQDREYVALDRNRFVPSDRGRMVAAFLAAFFGRYVEYGFTADLESRLDDVSNGQMEWKRLMREFWAAFDSAVRNASDLRISEVIDRLDEDLGPHFFPPSEDGGDPRKCPSCGNGRLGLKLSKNGGFIGCSNHPECGYTAGLSAYRKGEAAQFDGPRALGEDPESGLPVSIRNGPYGIYVQLGEAAKGSKKKPRRQSLPEGRDPGSVDLDYALALLRLPREIGRHPETGETMMAGFGRYGPYLKHGDAYASLGPEDDVLTIGLNRAVTVWAEKPPRGRGSGRAQTSGRALGDHPEDGKPVEVRDGRYGPYVRHGKLNATIPSTIAPETVTLDEAVELLAAKAAKAGGRGRAGRRRKAS